MFARSSRDCWVWWMVVSFWVREEREEERDWTEVWVEESFERCADSSFCWSSSLKVRSRKLAREEKRGRDSKHQRGRDQRSGDQRGE